MKEKLHTERLQIHISPKLHQKLQLKAVRDGLTVPEVTRAILAVHLRDVHLYGEPEND